MESKLRAAKSNSKDKSANLESKSKDKYKSPSELKRSHRRLREYLHENYSQEKECQTSLETSDCPTQASAVTSDCPTQASALTKSNCKNLGEGVIDTYSGIISDSLQCTLIDDGLQVLNVKHSPLSTLCSIFAVELTLLFHAMNNRY